MVKKKGRGVRAARRGLGERAGMGGEAGGEAGMIAAWLVGEVVGAQGWR